MTTFSQQDSLDGTVTDDNVEAPAPAKRPSRWSLKNWPVRWKVFAIVLVPLILAGAFGGLRIYSNAVEARELQRAADRVELVPAIVSYMNALNGAMLALPAGGDAQSAISAFDSSRAELQRRINDTADVPPDVQAGVTSMLQNGQALMDKVTSNSIALVDRVTLYAPILLTSEDAITGSVRVSNERIRAETQGLTRAVGARGQMMMEQLLVNQGGELPEPEQRTRMITLAGTEPSTLFGMSQVLGIGSPEAKQLQDEYVRRTAIISNPTVPIVNNPQLTASLQASDQIAAKMIERTVPAVTGAVQDEAATARTEAIRDSAIVLGAIAVVLLLVALVARSLVQPLRKLRDTALRVAHEDLAREIERVRAGKEPGPVKPIPVYTSEEVGQVAHAVDELHEQAVLLAGEQSRLQLQQADMFETLSRRSRSLVDQQLSLIDRLERNEEDPDRLESLFKLDHLAARMRRNGANLMVLAGAKVPREQAEPVAVSTIINAAASEVEDYTRVVTATVPDSEIVGSVAGDLVHLLAELLDNALRYSPPISQVRVSGVHTGNGGLVIEVSDIGLGMTESDLRVANTRLQSGGEVTPYTARHMGLFVVGRLAQQHGLVVRLRSTIAGEPNSGTTAGVYVPAELIVRGKHEQLETGEQGVVADAEAGIATTRALDEAGDYGRESEYGDEVGVDQLNGHSEVPVTLLPQRNPGASGIAGSSLSVDDDRPEPEAVSEAVSEAEQAEAGREQELEPEFDAAPDARPEGDAEPEAEPEPLPQRQAPANTSAFFASRAQAVSNGVHKPEPEPQSEPEPEPEPLLPGAKAPSPTAGADDAIYQKMLSEWLIDPTQIANSSALDWKFVWDHGWEAAEAAEAAPVVSHTEHGLPVRDPGARLVPGAAVPTGQRGAARGYANGGAHRSFDFDEKVESAEFAAGAEAIPARDPEAVRASMSSHFSAVHAARSHARDDTRETRGTDNV
ncbi:ATP-binding protein [Mycolicibacterium agri]|uniref:histidine kinase n=1 Tax=Mycolicibacterium agri TaxID=36811 RepID=A0A2A7NAB8_MYCAG|nr:sensor histidine kinase [Mycolicibacterium agri]PEG40408.1 ATP-binding protein [Mycolicibacterium agri]GFG51891.1 histidine kinase [Mycolicibacterium agri]